MDEEQTFISIFMIKTTLFKRHYLCISKSFNQIVFFNPCQLLYAVFTLHGFAFGFKFFIVNELHRKPAASVFGSLSAVVYPDSFFKIVCKACVEAIVKALKNIDVIQFNSSW